MSAPTSPFFSILIPAYNRPDFLCEAVRSVLANTWADFEIIVSEDRSPGQEQVMARLAGFSDPRLSVHAQAVNLGWSDNRNFLVRQARGQFVWLMGDDDLLPFDALARLHAFLSRHPGHDLYACGYEVIDEHGVHQYRRQAGRELFLQRDDAFTFRQVMLSQVVPFWVFHPFTFAYRRELGARFPYRRDALIGDDLLFLYECFRDGRSVAVTPEILFSWRKFSAAAGAQQVNLSSAVNGLRARAKILGLLVAEPVWKREIDALFPLGEFRRRYLHESLWADSSGGRGVLVPAIAGDPLLAANFTDYDSRWSRAHRWLIRLRMVLAYLRLNGAAGLKPLARRFWHEGRHKPRPSTPPDAA